MPTHHPYHFIPVAVPRARDLSPLDNYPDSLPPEVTHDRWVPGTRSGRILMRLETTSELILGGRRTPSSRGRPARIEPFQVPASTSGQFEPAIPATSLRGMFSALIEAASCSTLRVLNETGVQSPANPSWPRFTGEPGFPLNFFAAVSPELVPLGTSGERRSLTVAERLLGVVEQRHSKSHSSKSAVALASRVRFSHARLAERVSNPFSSAAFETLDLLLEPNLLSASLYFHPKEGPRTPIPAALLDPQDHRPNGRKQYPVQRGPKGLRASTDAPRLQVEARPLRPGLVFWFHIDFENLSDHELALLCYATSPTGRFRHRLGLGKPLGFGTVRLDPEALLLVDRRDRYARKDLSDASCRWDQAWQDPQAVPGDWPPFWDEEFRAFASGRALLPAPSVLDLGSDYRERVEPDFGEVLHALEVIGDPEASTPGLKFAYLVPSPWVNAFLPPLEDACTPVIDTRSYQRKPRRR